MAIDDVVPQKILAMKEKAIVMDLEMEEVTMATMDAKGILFVEATTAFSLVFTTMKRMTAVRNQLGKLRSKVLK